MGLQSSACTSSTSLASGSTGSRYSSASEGCLCLLEAWAAPGCDCPELSRSSAALTGCDLDAAVLLRCPEVSREFPPSTVLCLCIPSSAGKQKSIPKAEEPSGRGGRL